jgi:S-adenosylmethionine decarboxylase
MTNTKGVAEGGAVVGFEGPEKRLEVNFKRKDDLVGLRSLTKEKWQEMLDLAKCTIISQLKNDYCDSYVLSESSLFVFPFKIMLKTCGTTALLNCLPKILEIAENLNLEIELVIFSRKNFLFPKVQPHPHTDWNAEVNFLNNYFEGNSYNFGPLTEQHWYLYVADYTEENSFKNMEYTMEIMMHNLDPASASTFYKKEGISDHDKYPGIADIIPGSETDEFNFNPCGYSMNGLYDESYYTIHVTPEPHCSYASVETNLVLPSYSDMISYVLSIFKPGSFTIAYLSKNSCLRNNYMDDLQIEGYINCHKNICYLEGNHKVIVCNFESQDFYTQKKKLIKD